MRFLSFCLASVFALVLFASCSSVSPPTPRNWVEKDWPAHKYQDVAQLARSVVAQQFGYSPINWEHYAGDSLITFTSAWNYRGASRAVFSRSGKRRKIWVEVEEVALPMRYEVNAQDAKEPSTKNGKLRVEIRDGVPKRIVTQIAIACIRESNVSMQHASVPEKGEWSGDGADDQEVKEIMAAITTRLNKLRSYEFDISPEIKEVRSRYWREENLSPEEKERINTARTKKLAEEARRRREGN